MSLLLLFQSEGGVAPPPAEANNPGGRIVGTTFTRRRYREFQELLAAELAAAERADNLKKQKARDALNRAADAAREVGDGGNADLGLLSELTRALKKATAAKTQSEIIALSNKAIELAQVILGEDDDEEALILLMNS